MPLNIDPQGYAKSTVTQIPTYGGGGGMAPEMNPLLARIMRMRERTAEAELEQMRERSAEPGRARAFQKEMFELQNYTDKQRRQQEKRERGVQRGGPYHTDPGAKKRGDLRQAAQTLGLMQGGRGDPNIIKGTAEQMGMASPYLAALGGLGLGTGGTAAGPMPTEDPSLGKLRAMGLGPAEEPRFRRTPGGVYGGEPGYEWGGTGGLRGLGRQQGEGGKTSYSNIMGHEGYDPEFASPKPKSILGSRKYGGGIPKTGTYKLHKGEMVIPTKDVDPELVTYLTRKKIYDRAFEKSGGKSFGDYQEGSLEGLFKLAEGGDLAAFREILHDKGADEDQADEIIRTLGKSGGVETPEETGAYIKNYLQALGEDEPEEPEEPGGFARKIGAGIRGIGEKVVQPAIDLWGETAYGALQGLTGEDEPLPGMFGPQAPAGEPPLAAPPGEGLPGQQALEQLAGGAPAEPEFPEGSYEAASARAKAGDFGTPEDPLVLRGELSDIEQAQRDVERLPMYQEAKRKADSAESEANSIFEMLSKEGRAMSSDVYEDLRGEAERKMKLSKSFREITERQEKSTQAMLATSEKNLQSITKELAKQQAIGDRQQQLEEIKRGGRLNVTFLRGLTGGLPRLFAAAATGDSGDRARAEQQITEVFRMIALFEEMNATSSEERKRWRAGGEQAEANAEEFARMGKDEAMQMANIIAQRYSSVGELKGLMGGQ